MRPFLKKIGSIGLFFFVYCILRTLMAMGSVRVIGWKTLLTHVERCNGRCIIASNHPTLWEPIFIKVLLWPWCKEDFKRHPKNVTAVDSLNLYPRYIQALFGFAGLIPVDRDEGKQNLRLFIAMAHELKRGCPVIVCPEGRCTATPASRDGETDETIPPHPEGDQAYMLKPRSGVIRFATSESVPIVTVKVTLGKPVWCTSYSHLRELIRIARCGMTIECSESLFVSTPDTTADDLAHAILNPTPPPQT